MTWIKRDSREFWIGRHHKIGLVVLAEHQSAPKDSEFVSLFLVAEGRTASFKRSILRETISPAVGADDSRAAIHAFVGHLHRNFLKEEGFGFAGVRVYSDALRRDTHCYRCKGALSSDSYLQCLACHWLVCSCGACGCGYSGPSRAA